MTDHWPIVPCPVKAEVKPGGIFPTGFWSKLQARLPVWAEVFLIAAVRAKASVAIRANLVERLR